MKYLLLSVAFISSLCIAQADSTSRVILYENPNYSGHTLALEGAGEYRDLNDKSRSSTRDWDNAISAIEFNGSFKVTLYRDKDFSGPSVSFTTSQSNLFNVSGVDWDNQATSVTWEPVEISSITPQAIFYDRPNYQGNSFTLNADQSILRLRSKRRNSRTRTWDDQIRSIRVYGSTTKVTLYSEERFRGKQLQITKDTPDLSGQRFSGIASSLLIANTAPRRYTKASHE